MISDVTAIQYQRLDFGSYNYEAPPFQEALTKIWEYQLSQPVARTFLRWLGDKLVLVAAPDGVAHVTRTGVSAMPALIIPFFQIYRGFESDPVVVAEDGKIYRWTSDLNLVFIMDPHTSKAAVEPMGFPSEDLLLSIHKEKLFGVFPRIKPWVTRFIVGNRQRTGWSDNRFLRNALPDSRGMFVNYELASNVVRYVGYHNPSIWECAINEPIDAIIGRVKDHLWIATASGKLSAISIEKGVVEHSLTVPHAKNPLCTIDECGRLIICNGIGISVLDGASGELLSQKSIRIRDGKSSSTAHGNTVLITKDDHVIYNDYHSRVFKVALFDKEPGILLWESPERIRGYGLLSDQLVVLGETSLIGLV